MNVTPVQRPSDSDSQGIRDETQLEAVLTQPTDALVEFIRKVSSPLVILGAGGKMGPTLALLARHAAEMAGHTLEILAASRFADSKARHWLESRGIKTQVCDLLEPKALAQLPEAENIIYLVGLKFGTSRNPELTWATNTLVPAYVCQRFPRSRVVALSTGNVYPLTAVPRGGALEGDPLTPVGEYANAAVGRERVFEFCAARCGTRVALLRLCYAIDLRYGVLVDIARQVHSGTMIDLSTGAFNCIWQGDANEMILRALPLADCPATVWNLCRPEVFSVREVATRIGKRFGRIPRFAGQETETALLANPAKICERLGRPPTDLETMLGWIADWIEAGGPDLGKPTHFETRDGNY